MFQKLDKAELIKRANEGTLIGAFSVSNEDYHSGPGVSRSQLVDILECPALYKYKLANPTEPTAEMKFGSAVHARLLEPQEFHNRYVYAPEGRRGTNAYKTFELENQGRVILTDEERFRIEALAAKFLKNEIVTKLLSGIIEVAFYWKDAQTGILCKCKPDALNEFGLIDLKTSSYMGRDEFSKDMANMHYHMQAAFYLWGINEAIKQAGIQGIAAPKMFTFLVMAKREPFLFAAYKIGNESLLIGEELYRTALNRLKECLETNHFPEYLDDRRENVVEEIEIPQWARRKVG